MTGFFKSLALLMLIGTALIPVSVEAKEAVTPILGKPEAPITVEEFASLTCSHCAEFANNVLPELEKKYVETGKVKFIMHDFPLDGWALKAAALARCMPHEQFYPFIKILYKSQQAWMDAEGGPEKTLIQYAQLGGLDGEKAKACIEDSKAQDAIVAARVEAAKKYNIEATPTFVINQGAETMKGARNVEEFSAVFDRLLAKKQ